jgi:hypothetical protein
MSRSSVPGLLLLGVLLSTSASAQQAKNKKPPPKAARTVKLIMEETHKGADNPASEVRHGRGTEEQQKILLKAYQEMAAMKAPVGDAKSWQAKTGAVIAALNDLIAKKGGAVERVYATTDCRSCHDPHRPGGNK